MKGYLISDQTQDMDIPAIHKFISQSYWAQDIPLPTLKRSIENSLCFGVFTHENEQVGFARLITDQATFAYLADVFIAEHHRGKGLSKWLIKTIIEHPKLQGLRRMVLATKDAHGLYSQYGFKNLATPDIFMERHQASVYQAL